MFWCKVGRFVAAVGLMVAALLGLSACKGDPPCVRSHVVTIVTFMPVGKTLFPVTSTYTVCDEYARRNP